MHWQVLRGLLICLLVVAGLLTDDPWVAADQLDDDVRAIAKQLRCPICESVSVADSPAELAVQMRGVIRRKLEAGESERQILDYFVAAYGDSVLLEPPRRGLGWAVWLGPLIVLAAGAGILWFMLHRWVQPHRRRHIEAFPTMDGRAAATPQQPDLREEPAPHTIRARQELDALRKGLDG
jgi:cytochrome c-type biogenesis protein CcmH